MRIKKILSILLCFAMTAGLFPAVDASAEELTGSLVWHKRDTQFMQIVSDPAGTNENAILVTAVDDVSFRDFISLPETLSGTVTLAFSVFIPSEENPGRGVSGRRMPSPYLGDADGSFIIGGSAQFASSAAKIYPMIVDDATKDGGKDNCGDTTRDDGSGYDRWLNYTIQADLSAGTHSSVIDGDTLEGSFTNTRSAAARFGITSTNGASTAYFKDISINGMAVQILDPLEDTEDDSTGYAPPECTGTAPRAVTYLYDSAASDEDGQFTARFNWVTSPAVEGTYLYYAKQAEFDENQKYSMRVEGRSQIVDLSQNAIYQDVDTISLAPVRSHKAETLTLDAATTYVWCVGDGNGNVSEQGSLTTPAADTDTFNFIWITDPQTNGSSYDSTLGYYESYAGEALNQAVSDYSDAAFVLSTGDNVNFVFDTWQWDALFEANREVFDRYPFYFIPGNHEYNGYPRYTGSSETIDPTLSALKGRFNAPQTGAAYYGGGVEGREPLVNGLDKLRLDGSNYYFVYGDTLILMLENVDSNEVVEEQIQWMKSVVKNNPTKWCIAALHCSLFPGWRFEDWENEKPYHFKEWTEGLAEAGVDLVLMGHDHVYVRTSAMDTEDTVAASEASGTVYITNNPATNAMEYVYNKDWAYTEAWSQSFGCSYADIQISPSQISITAKGHYKEDLAGSGEGVLTVVDNEEVIKRTPRTPQLGGYQYPDAAAPAKAGLESVVAGGIAREEQTLLAMTAPRTTSAQWQWQVSDNGQDGWEDIPGAKDISFAVTETEVGKYLRVIATGKGDYSGTVVSDATAEVKPLHAGGANEAGYTMDLTDVPEGGLPDGWATDNPQAVYVTAAPDGDGKALKVADNAAFIADLGFGTQRGASVISYKLWVETLGDYDFGPETPRTSGLMLLDTGGNPVLSHAVMTWPDCGGEFYFEDLGRLLGSKGVYKSEGNEFALTNETVSGKWIDVVYSFDFSSGTFTFTFGGDTVYTNAPCNNSVFDIPATCENIAALRLTSGTPDVRSSVFYYKDLVVGDGGSASALPERWEASQPWDRAIKENVWTITDPGAGGAMPAIGEGPDGLLVAAGDLSGVYISDDDGLNWRNSGKEQGLVQMHVSSLGFDPSNGDVFYVGTEGDLYRTEDAGRSFTPVCKVDEELNSYWTAIAVSEDGQTVYAAVNGAWNGFTRKIYVSRDGGRSFAPEDAWSIGANNGAADTVRVFKMIVPKGNPDALIVLSQTDAFISWNEEGPAEAMTGYFVTADGGQTWTALTGGVDALVPAPLGRDGGSGYTERDMAFDACDASVVYLTDSDGVYAVSWNDNRLIASSAGGNGGYVSTKDMGNGKTLVRTITNSDQDPAVREILVSSPAEIDGEWTVDSYSRTVAFHEGWPGDAPLAYSHGLVQSLYNPDVYYSTGSQWAFRFHQDNGVKKAEPVYTDITGDGAFRGRGLSNVVPHMVAVSPVNPDIIYGAFADIGFWYSLDGGMSWSCGNNQDYSGWSPYNGGDCLFVAPDPTEEGVIWAAYGNGTYYITVLKSEDNGATWTTPANQGLPEFDDGVYGGRILGIAVDPGSDPESRTLYITCGDEEWGDTYSVYKSEDGAESWTDVTPAEGSVYMSIAVDPEDSGIVYAGAAEGLYRSTDGGGTWTLSAGVPDLSGSYWESDNDYIGVLTIAISPSDPNVVYVSVGNTEDPGTSCGIYKSVDRGVSFQKLTVDAALDMYAASVAVHPENPDIVFASASNVTRSGGKEPEGYLALSLDGGKTWKNHTEGLAYPTVRSIAISASEPEIVVIGAQGMSLQMRRFNYDGDATEGSVTVSPSARTLRVGESFQLRAEVTPENADIVWTSSDSSVAIVDGTGKVTALSVGRTAIMATSGGKSGTCEVKVIAAAEVDPIRPKPDDTGSGSTAPKPDNSSDPAVPDTDAGSGIPKQDILPFTDVNAGDWFYDSVSYMYQTGLMAGIGSGLFAPNQELTRSMISTILYRMEGEAAVPFAGSFPDVSNGTWYSNAVEWAKESGLVVGRADGTFGPADVVTREQTVVILYRYAVYKGYPVQVTEGLSAYLDQADVSDYARTAMQWAVSEKILNGDGGKLLPHQGATRAQIAAILTRFCQNVSRG